MEQTNLPSNPAQVTKELVKASFNIELTRLNYQAALQAVENIEWTRENIDQDLLAPGTFVAKKLTEQKELIKRPYIDAGKIIQNEYNEVFNPLNDAISRKANEKNALADKIQKEVDLANAEIARVNGINSAMATFISDITNQITSADNDKMIVAIEMRIGSELARKNIYQEMLPQMKSQCEELKPLIKMQKDYIKKLNEATKSEAAAVASGDDDKLIVARENVEVLKETIEENKLRLQQKAFEQVENSGTEVGMPTAVAPKPSRRWWTWEVTDVNALYKKRPELVDLVPNKQKIDEIFDKMKANGDFSNGKPEIILNGIRFFEEKSFK
jgi:hypothetical protein